MGIGFQRLISLQQSQSILELLCFFLCLFERHQIFDSLSLTPQAITITNSDVCLMSVLFNHLAIFEYDKHSICTSMIPTIRKLAQSIMSTSSILTPLKELKVSKHQIPAHGLTPNTSIQNKPLLLYRSAFKANTSASQIEEHLSKVGVVDPAWRYTVRYSYSHTSKRNKENKQF
jgi:hypothetical protein